MYETLQNDKRFDSYLGQKATCLANYFKNLIKITVHESKARK